MKRFVLIPIVLSFALTVGAQEVDLPTLVDRATPLLGRPGGLTSDEVARRAVATSPDLKAHQEATRQTRLGLSEANANFLPTVTTAASYTRYSQISQSTPGTVNMLENETGFNASISVPVSDYALKLFQAKAAATHLAKASEFETQATLRQTAANARISYYDWIRARIRQVIAEQSLEQAREQLADVKARHRVGSMILADVLQSEAQLKEAELTLIKAQQAVVYANETLRVAMHLEEALNQEIGETLPQESTIEATVNIGDLQQEALARRPELLAFQENQEVTHFQRYVTQSGWYPRLDLKGGDTYSNPNARYFPPQDQYRNNWSLGAQLAWTPSSIPALSFAAAADRSRQSELVHQADVLSDAIRLEVLKAQQAIDESQSAIVSTKQSLLASEEAYRVRRGAFRANKANLVELTDSETKLTRARIDALNARIDARVARVRLAHALGRDLLAP